MRRGLRCGATLPVAWSSRRARWSRSRSRSGPRCGSAGSSARKARSGQSRGWAVINSWFGGDSLAVSDADGNYSAVVVREVNQAFGWPIRNPPALLRPERRPRGTPADAHAGQARTAAARARAGARVDLPGVVVDEAGKPAGGAEVESVSGQSILARADGEGRFVLSGVDPLRELKLVARRGPASAGTPVTIRAGNLGSTPLQADDPTRSDRAGRRAGGRPVGPAGRRGLGPDLAAGPPRIRRPVPERARGRRGRLDRRADR